MQLETWPNLSRQPDAAAWLSVLARLSGRALGIDALRRAAEAEGIPAPRARHGVGMLLLFRHAQVVVTATTDPVVRHAPQAPAPHPAGLLGRIRARLRALAD